MPNRWSRLLPITGLLSVALIIISFLLSGDTLDMDASGDELAQHYKDDEDTQMIASVLLAWGAILLVPFVACLRSRAFSKLPSSSSLPTIISSGGLMMSLGLLLFAGINFTLTDAADDVDPAALQALNALNLDLFFPLAAGVALLLTAVGIAGLREGFLPKALAIVALIIGFAAATPLGFFAFLLSGIWIIAASIWMLTTTNKTELGGAGRDNGPAATTAPGAMPGTTIN